MNSSLVNNNHITARRTLVPPACHKRSAKLGSLFASLGNEKEEPVADVEQDHLSKTHHLLCPISGWLPDLGEEGAAEVEEAGRGERDVGADNLLDEQVHLHLPTPAPLPPWPIGGRGERKLIR